MKMTNKEFRESVTEFVEGIRSNAPLTVLYQQPLSATTNQIFDQLDKDDMQYLRDSLSRASIRLESEFGYPFPRLSLTGIVTPTLMQYIR